MRVSDEGLMKTTLDWSSRADVWCSCKQTEKHVWLQHEGWAWLLLPFTIRAVWRSGQQLPPGVIIIIIIISCESKCRCFICPAAEAPLVTSLPNRKCESGGVMLPRAADVSTFTRLCSFSQRRLRHSAAIFQQAALLYLLSLSHQRKISCMKYTPTFISFILKSLWIHLKWFLKHFYCQKYIFIFSHFIFIYFICIL